MTTKTRTRQIHIGKKRVMVIVSKEIKIENTLMKTNTWIDIAKRILIVRTMMKTE
jgi:hypothetical protein